MSAEVATDETARARFQSWVTDERGRIANLQRSLGTTSRELGGLAGRPDHPDRWLEGPGQQFSAALAAKIAVERELGAELAAGSTAEVTSEQSAVEMTPGRDGREPPSEPVREAPDAGGLDLS